KIIMTHHDIDHIGNLATIVKSSDHKIEVLTQAEEKPYIQGDLPPVKAPRGEDQDANEHFKLMSPELRQAVFKVFENFKMFTVPVDQALADGQVLPFCGGITVIHTPGHTPGHICLYLHQSQVLIAGDALFVEDGSLVPAPALLNFNTDLAHSFVIRPGVNQQLHGCRITSISIHDIV
ncbi:MAG: MBL fold metallo-hydrolase, partial [Firmicutes bacterium]|nr:MBL fold metallo-hydrolase [Bacillota bacterium]